MFQGDPVGLGVFQQVLGTLMRWDSAGLGLLERVLETLMRGDPAGLGGPRATLQALGSWRLQYIGTLQGWGCSEGMLQGLESWGL